MRRLPPAALVWSWAALLALLALTVTLAYQPLGSFNTPAALAIAAIKVLIIAAVFMELRERRPLVLSFAAAGLFWLAILLWLGSTDFLTRPEFPPGLRSDAAER
jgi:cytochrome c oxidase subunit 4